MILAYLKDSLHWLHLFCFKQRTFEREADELSRKQTVTVFLKVYPWFWLGGLLLLLGIAETRELIGHTFQWQRVFVAYSISGLLFGLIFALIPRQSFGLIFRLSLGLSLGLSFGPSFGLIRGMSIWLIFGLSFGLIFRLIRGLSFGLNIGLSIWLIFGLSIGASDGLGEAVRFVAAYFLVFLASFGLAYWRPYYWPFYLAQFWQAQRDGNWRMHFQHSPVHWDETIGAPLPWLSDWLFEIAKVDRQEGLAEVLWVAEERPFQRKAAQKALLKLAVYDLLQMTTVAQLARADQSLEFLPEDEKLAPAGIPEAAERLKKIAALAKDYLLRHTANGQHKALLELQRELQSFQTAMALLPAPTGIEFQQVAAQWLATVNAAEAELCARLPMENPFKVGNALLEYEQDLFKGRRDLIVKLEEAIFTNHPSLLLYGRRRTGKTSTLLNLPRLMSSQFVPVFIDCQNARWSDSDAMFCYHLARALHDELVKRRLAEGLAQPDKSEFERHAFTRLDEFLDDLESHSRRIGKQILLTFDEYERLEEGIRDGKLTRAVLNQIRAIVQHRQQLIVLFSGSHRFEESQAVNWSDYLINVQTLHLSFLTRDEARELLEHPSPEFALGYAPGVVDSVLALTHGQPYLVQALGSELVNLINKEKRKQATQADLDVAVERVLSLVEGYFENTWRDCNDAEQAVLIGLAQQQTDGLSAAETQRALRGLSRKELIERNGEQWQFTVELFRLWVRQEKTIAATVLSAA